ncbi:hypothetical protein TNCV_658491 [Trichonephila clavipes]|uniref:Uncharacterized protein n=1 Tax=Trichonephila clavipes TaxID=2585209 RepID=A0A8X6T006_TRICX|nr:hypothetical protein TNCV_658491 [Trichonephila clavipes]
METQWQRIVLPHHNSSVLSSGLGKVDSAFHPFRGLINSVPKLVWELNTGGFVSDYLIGTSAFAPQRPMVTYTEMVTVGLILHGLLHH